MPLGAFITEFEGLSGSAKQKQIRTVAPGVTHLSQLAGRDEVIAALHSRDVRGRQAHARHPARPGRRRALPRACWTTNTGCARFWFKSTTIIVGGIPWVIEVAVADTLKPGRTWFAVNHAPSFGDPLARAALAAGRDQHHGCGVVSYGCRRGR